MALIFTITTLSRLMLARSSKTMSSGSDVCALTDVCSEEWLKSVSSPETQWSVIPISFPVFSRRSLKDFLSQRHCVHLWIRSHPLNGLILLTHFGRILQHPVPGVPLFYCTVCVKVCFFHSFCLITFICYFLMCFLSNGMYFFFCLPSCVWFL